jgi:hypothetical protein
MKQAARKLQLRVDPPVVAGQQELMDRLLKADEWTSEPENPPVEAPRAARKPKPEKKAEPEKKPWEVPSEEATHAYHIILPKRLFVKLDYVWKREGHRSAREYVIKALQKATDEGLKRLGEK